MSPGEKKVMVATDGSAPARRAEREAARMATALGLDEIVVVYVVRRTGSATGGFLAPKREDDEESAKWLVELAVKRIQEFAPDLKVTPLVLDDPSPVRAITKEVERGEYRSVVIGNRGRGGFGSMALGSVSTGVIHNVQVPVVLVK